MKEGPYSRMGLIGGTGLAQAKVAQQLIAILEIFPAAAKSPDFSALRIGEHHGRLRLGGDPFFSSL